MTPTLPVTCQFRTFVQSNAHALTLIGLVMALMGDWAELYRAFLYLNLILTAVTLYRSPLSAADRQIVVCILSVPFAFMLLHMLAVGRVELVKEIRHLWLAAFAALGVWALPKPQLEWLDRSREHIVITLTLFFIVVQVFGFAVVLTDEFSGAMRNPHYLSYYSALALVASGALLLSGEGKHKLLLMISAVFLLAFILISSSRPAWIALLTCLCLWLLFRPSLRKAWLILLAALLLYATNPADLATRMDDLLVNITQEERVTIWQSAFRLQMESTPVEWLAGHGTDRFVTEFASFAPAEYSDHEYQFPHNSILEVIYMSGLCGLILMLAIYFVVYKRLFRLAGKGLGIAAAGLFGFTFHWLIVFITFPLISPYNMYPLALLIGACLRNPHRAADYGPEEKPRTQS